jgi:putative FmdB family regulatory protein
MPIYEYRCESGHNFDVMQRMSEDPLTSCEVCGAPAQRVLHAPAVHFKGSGFYNTDYGTKKRARELRGSGEGGSSTSDSTSSGSESTSGTSSSDAGSSNGGTRSDSNAKASAAS